MFDSVCIGGGYISMEHVNILWIDQSGLTYLNIRAVVSIQLGRNIGEQVRLSRATLEFQVQVFLIFKLD